MEGERRTGRTDENAEEKTEISAAVDYEEKRDWFVQPNNRLRIGVGNDIANISLQIRIFKASLDATWSES